MVIKPITAVMLCSVWVAVTRLCGAQSLSPRAYIIVPVHSNAVTLTYSLNEGDVVFNGLPVTDSNGRIGSEIFSYFHTFDCFGRSANVTVLLPYAVGHFRGDVNGVRQELYRSGLGAAAARVSVNLIGARAMNLEEYSRWKQKTLLGASLTVLTPTGQYDRARLINIGEHRWAFKPEIGLSRRWRKWMLDAYGAAWFYTPNNDFFSSAPGSTGPNRQTQEPMGAVELHLSYDVKPRLWVSADGNYWYGGKTSLNGVESPTTLQANSRLGATAAIPITKNQSLKFSYSRGTYVTFGGNFQNVSAAWQYSWIGRPN
jgi:Putative MetA-pathway of phenol degradation